MVKIQEINFIYRHATAVYRSVINMGIKLFNKLPIQIKQLNNHKGFKWEVKTCLLHNLLYTIEEFMQFGGI